MSVTFYPAPKLRLTKLISREGGITVAEAIDRAEAGLADIAEPCREALDAALAHLETCCEALLPGAGPEVAREAYIASDQVFGLSGPAGMKELGAAAYSLCELIDRFQNGAPVKASALKVHLGALALLRRPVSETGGEAGRKAVLEGLSRVVKSV